MSERKLHDSWVRYPAAIIVAFTTSITTLLAFFLFQDATNMKSDSSPILSVVAPICGNFLIGFNGVFGGSLCLRRCDKVFGAIVLLGLGICFEILMLGTAHGEFHIPRGAIPTGIGGSLAVALLFWRMPPTERRRWLKFQR
jgi:hypothetical protein